MAINNPYIDKVKSHINIINDIEKIYSNRSKWNEYFWNNNEIFLEIWTWLWNFFSKEIKNNPNINYLWMEIKYKRLYIWAEKSLWNLNNYVHNWVKFKSAIDKNKAENDLGQENVNFALLKDFWENIDKIFKLEEISRSYIFFPDPWAKKKRWLKNRLLQTNFLNNLFLITKKDWKAIIKTDHLEYFEFILEEVKKTSWEITKKSFDWENDNDFDNEETTEFQQLFRWQKIKINYLELQKK